MDNIILKSISAENFGPFKDKVIFTTESKNNISEKNLLDNNTINCKDNRYNIVSYIYGMNGAGKTNICRIVSEIKRIIMLSPILATTNQELLELEPLKNQLMSSVNNFKFSEGYNTIPTSFGIELIIDNITYSYSFKTLNGNIVEEILKKKDKRTEIILNRTSSNYNDIILKSELSDFKNNIPMVKDNVLCLSMASFVNYPFATKLISAINSIQIVSMSSAALAVNKENLNHENKKQFKKFIDILKISDPTLKDIIVSYEESKLAEQKIAATDFENRNFIIRNVHVDVTSVHNVYDSKKEIVSEIELPFLKFESNGTIKMLSIIPIILNVLENGGVLIVDEIENGLHPNLVKLIISYFYNKNINKNNSQLICTTHSPLLIEQNVKRDQIWVATKNIYGESSLDRFSNYGFRKNSNLMQKLLKEIFGFEDNYTT